MNEPGYYHALGPDEAIKQHFLDETALEAMKVLLAEQDIEQHENLEEYQNSVAASAYGMAHAMWRAKNGELEDAE